MLPIINISKEKQIEVDRAVARMTNVIARRPKDHSYQNEYKRFVTWVVENGLRQGDNIYIHRVAVDEYFRQSVVLRTCAKSSISRIINALQWFHDNLESPGSEFLVKSGIVFQAMAQQKENWTHMPSANLGTDPHRGLKDVLTEPDKKKILAHIHHNRLDWGSLCTSFLWGNNAGVRGASSRKFNLPDLFMSRGFGPTKEGPRARTLLLVLRKGDPHKDRFTTDRMVACWRHRSYMLCSIFNTALHVINSLRQHPTINFYHKEKTAAASWWGIPLIEYEELYDESGPMKEVYMATGVEGCKLTHNRTYAVQHAGSEGLAPHQINSFTKHMLEKLHKSYQSEVDKEACKVMAGFGREEGYFVEREFLQPPWETEELINFLLPKYSAWLQQAASRHGDKSSACRRFLNDIIPYMVEVIVQDGVYFIMDFPNHEMSNYLKVSTTVVVLEYSLFFVFNLLTDLIKLTE
jgi:hypothetical protein